MFEGGVGAFAHQERPHRRQKVAGGSAQSAYSIGRVRLQLSNKIIEGRCALSLSILELPKEASLPSVVPSFARCIEGYHRGGPGSSQVKALVPV